MGKLKVVGQRGECNGKLDVIKLKNPVLDSVLTLMSWLFRSHSIKTGIKNIFILYIISPPLQALSSCSQLRSF